MQPDLEEVLPFPIPPALEGSPMVDQVRRQLTDAYLAIQEAAGAVFAAHVARVRLEVQKMAADIEREGATHH